MFKPLLGPCDSYQLEPFSYPWAWEMSRAQENNNWAPEEIQVGPDVADYKSSSLDPKHKHLFEAVMAQLTTFDILRGDEIAETLQPLMQPAEIKHFLKRMAWDEALHTRSYRFVIENLGIPLEIYTRYQTVPEFRARVDMCDEISKPLLKILGWNYLHDEPSPQSTWIASKQAILRSMIFYFLIFEGTWFWISLMGPIQQLARLGIFKGAAEQFTYIARDEQQHVGFGIQLIREFLGQYPECLTKEFLEQVYSDVARAMNLERDYIQHCLKDGPILGYSAEDHMATAEYFANLRLRSVGLGEFFLGAYHAFPWMSEQMELKKEKNFFETRVTEYQASGALSFDDEHPHHEQPGWSDPFLGIR